MGRFDRYVLSQLLRVFGFFSLILVGVYWVNRAVILLERYLSEGQAGGLVLQLTLLSLPAIMMIVMPIAGFVAAAYTTNRLHADSELVVMQATGYSAFRMCRPFFLFGLIVAVILSLLAHVLVPKSMRQLNSLEEQLAEAISARLIVPGTFQSPVKGVTVYVRDVGTDGKLDSMLVADRRDPERHSTYSASSAYLLRGENGPTLVMIDGLAQTLDLASQSLATTQFDDFTLSLGDMITGPTNRRLDYRQLGTLTLLSPSPEIQEETRRSADFLKREAHQRITQALLSIGGGVLGFAALMIGGFSRFGLWKQIAFAVLLIVLVKLIDNASIDVAKSDPALWPIVYLSSIVSAVVCFGLLLLADASLLMRLRRRRAS